MNKLVMTAALQEAATGIGKPADTAIIRERGYRKFCAKWAPKILTVEYKTAGKNTCAEFLQHNEKDGDVYVRNNNQ
jgi:hypothetical protein